MNVYLRHSVLILLLFSAYILSAQDEEELYKKGEILIDNYQYSKALSVFNTLIALNKKRAYYYEEKAFCEFKMKNYSGALGTLNKGIAIMPDSVGLYHKKAMLYENLNDSKQAIETYTLGLSKAKDSLQISDLYTFRGASKSKLRQFESAYHDQLKALSYKSDNIFALNNIAAVCDEVGKPDETLKYLRQVIDLKPDFAPAYINIGFKFQEMEKFEKSIEFFDKAILLDPEEALGYSNRSYSKLKTDDKEGALSDINYSLELMPSNSYAYKIKALIFIEEKEYTKACEALHLAQSYDYSINYGDEVEELMKQYCTKE